LGFYDVFIAIGPIVAGITRSAPYFEDSKATWSTPLSKGTMARMAPGFLMAVSAHPIALL
jgi:hypothetical protein